MIRKSLLIWITIVTSIIFIFRLGSLQLSNDFYKSASSNNAIQELAVYPERGLMFDRNGKLLQFSANFQARCFKKQIRRDLFIWR